MKTGIKHLPGITIMATLVYLISMGQAQAWNPNHLDQLLKLRACPRCDLSGADLKGKNLSGYNFYKANLKGAFLNNAILINASFVEADLRGATLDGAILNGTNFSGAHSWFNPDLKCATPSIGGCFDECRPGSTCY